MAVVRTADFPRFLSGGWKKSPIILLFGPDEGGVRTRAAALVAEILGPDAEMNRVSLEAEPINADPARLLDEANAISMFGGRRVVLVGQAGKLQKTAWQPLIDVPPVDSVVLLVADDLARSSPLRIAAEASPVCAAVACYAPSRQDVLHLIETRAREAGMTVTPVARAYLADLLGSDQALTEAEIDKLILYCRGKLTIEPDDIDALVTDSSDLAGTEPVDRAFDGRLEEIEPVALRSFREGINPSALLAIALNHTMSLRRLALARSSGAFEPAFKSEKLHFKRADRVRKQALAWDVPLANRALEIVAEAQDQARRTPTLEETIAIRALWSIALASRRR